jgi:hypothetical protein
MDCSRPARFRTVVRHGGVADMNRARLERLEHTIAGSQCPDCAESERVIIIEQLVIVSPGDGLAPPTPEKPSPQRCPRCGRDWSSQPRIVEAICLDWTECKF